MNILDALLVLAKKKKTLIIIPFVFSILTFIIISLLPKVYYSETRVRINDSNSPAKLALGLNKNLASLFGQNLSSESQIMYDEILSSRNNLVAAIRKFSLDTVYKKKPIDLILKQWKKDLVIEVDKNGTVRCGMMGTNRELIISVTSYLVQNANETYMNLKNEQLELNTHFLKEKMDELMDTLENYNSDLVAFYKKNNVLNIEEQIKLSLNAIATYEEQIKVFEQQRSFAKKSSGYKSPKVKELNARINILKSEILSLRETTDTSYTPLKGSLLINTNWGLDQLFFERITVSKIEIVKEFLGFVSKELAMAEAEKKNQIPIIQVIQEPYFPEWKVKPKRATYMVASFVISFIFLYGYIIYNGIEKGEITIKNKADFEKLKKIIETLKSWN